MSCCAHFMFGFDLSVEACDSDFPSMKATRFHKTRSRTVYAFAVLFTCISVASCDTDSGQPQSSVLGEGTACTIQPTTIDFDTVAVGSGRMASFRATNHGPGKAVGNFHIGDPQSHFSADVQTYSLDESESQDFTVWFTPKSAGRHSLITLCGLVLTGVGVVPP